MNELFLFHWLSWLLIIVVYFFMQHRVKYLFLVLLCSFILTITIDITIFEQMTMSLAYILLSLSSLIFLSRFQLSFYRYVVMVTITTAYIALLLWHKLMPVWFVIHAYLLIPIIVTLLTVILIEPYVLQIAVTTFTLTFGQFMYCIILFSYSLTGALFTYSFFIMFYISMVCLFIYYLIRTSFVAYRTRYLSY